MLHLGGPTNPTMHKALADHLGEGFFAAKKRARFLCPAATTDRATAGVGTQIGIGLHPLRVEETGAIHSTRLPENRHSY